MTTSINDLIGSNGLREVVHSTISTITYNTNGTINTYIKNGATYTVAYNANGFVSLISGDDGRTYTPTYNSNFRVTDVTVT